MPNKHILRSNICFGLLRLLCLVSLGVWLFAGVFHRPAKVSRPAQQPSVAVAHLPIVCIDPGHPSEVNAGSTLQNGLREVEVVYDVALTLKEELENPVHPVARVVMTRDFREATGRIVTNRQRAEIANKAGAVLLLRLHTDTGPGSGYAIYYPDRTGKARDGRVGPAAHLIAESESAARTFHEGMAGILRTAATPLPDNGVKGERATQVGAQQGALTGSVYAEEPVLTVEMVYLSNPYDAGIIGSAAGQQLMADALAAGVRRYLASDGYSR